MARLLVIDDDVIVSRLLKEHLTSEGHEVTTTARAEEGLREAKKTPPDLILLDVMLPDATGYQACGKLRMESGTQQTPIIMMSGAARSASQQALGRLMGANEYLLKPFNIIDVGDKVHQLLASSATVPAPVPAPVPEIPDFHLERMFSIMLCALKEKAEKSDDGQG